MRSLLVAIIAVTAISTSVLAQAPDLLSFQGRLADSLGAVLDTTVGMTFKLYKDGSAVWTEAHASVTVTGGIFSVLLGGTTPLDTMAFNAPFDLGITVGTDAEISPRTPLAAAAYSEGHAWVVHVLS